VDEEAVRGVDGAREHHVGGAVVQAVAGELDGVERRGAGGVERVGPGAEAQRRGREVRREAGHEAVAGVRAVEPGDAAHGALEGGPCEESQTLSA
jgi:hypothetical protein